MAKPSTVNLVPRQQILGEVGGWRQTVAQRLLDRLIRRGRWALHRHVHLAQAFDDARDLADGHLGSVLSLSCSPGTTELFLALCNPGISFTLTDADRARVRRMRLHAWLLGLRNVRVRRFDPNESLLEGRRYDFIAAIDVFEHVEDDHRAAAAMIECSNLFVYVLVPFTTDAELADEKRREREWERHGRHRPGYTAATLARLVGSTDLVWLRNCYFQPEGDELRARLESESDEELEAHRGELVDLARSDIRDELVEGGREEATSIEVLAAVY